MARPIVLIGLSTAIVAGSACSPPAPGATAQEVVQPTAPPRRDPVRLTVNGAWNRMPSLATSGNRVAVVWTATVDDVMDVYAATSEDGGATFTVPQRVNDRDGDVSSNAEQPPRVTLNGDVMTVIWPSRLDGGSALRMSRSTDGGRTFATATRLHDQSLTGLRGWQAIAGGRDGAVHAVWLDGRHADPAAAGHHHHSSGASAARARPPAGPRQDLFTAVIAPDGSTSESHIARDVCFCCKTAVAIAPGGRVFVAWRHIFPESLRDIAVATSVDGGRTFGPASRASEDGWKLSGCPDDGPSMAADAGGTVHLAWPTLIQGENPRKAVFYTATRDGESFAARTELSNNRTEDAGHPQIAADGAGQVAAAWDEQADDRRQIVLRVSRGGRSSFGPPQVLTEQDSGFHPVVAGLPRGFLVAWPHGSREASAIRIRRVDP